MTSSLRSAATARARPGRAIIGFSACVGGFITAHPGPARTWPRKAKTPNWNGNPDPINVFDRLAVAVLAVLAAASA
ncbi:MAG: hypothetical protein ABI680_06760, partial [Chthoniobacteraceae bacterium]